MLENLNSQKVFRITLGLMFCYVLYALYCQMTLYYSGLYSYLDLGLINDILGNTANQNKSFWVTDLGINHLSLHFTSILFLVTPLYKIFDSQLLFPILCILAIGASLFLLLFLVREIFNIFELRGNEKSWGYLVCLFIFITNPYLKSLMLSTHYEAFYLLFSILFLYGLIKNFRWFYLFLIMILLLSCRQDAGIFFLFPLSVLLLPACKKIRGQILDFKKKIIIFPIAMILYSLITIKLIMPLFAEDRAQMSSLVKTFWGQWGNTYSEIFIHMLTSPLKVLKCAYDGGFWRLNRSFYFLPALDLPSFLVINLPGFIFYTSSDFYKNQLIFYNSAFLLPGFYLVSIIMMKKLLQSKIVVTKKMIAPISILMIILALMNFPHSTYGMPSNLKPGPTLDRYKEFNKVMSYAEEKYHPESFAASDKDFVFLPNSKVKYLPRNAAKADVLIVEKDKNIFAMENHFVLDTQAPQSVVFDLWVRASLAH